MSAKSARDREMLEMRRNGATLEEIGSRYGVTRERVRQIVDREGKTAADSRRRRRELKEQSLKAEVANLADAIGNSITQLAEDGQSRATTETIVAALFPSATPEVIAGAITKTGAVFEWSFEDKFSEAALEAAYFYLHGRHHGLIATPADALTVLSDEEIKDIVEILIDDEVPRTDISKVLCVIAGARRALEQGHKQSITKAQYDKERVGALTQLGLGSQKGEHPWPPTSQTLYKRLGGGYWKDMVIHLGLEPHSRGRVRGEIFYSEEDYLEAVRTFVLDPLRDNRNTTFRGYQQWVDQEEILGRRHPSSAAIRLKFGSWQKAKRAALQGGLLTGATSTRAPAATSPVALRRSSQQIAEGLEKLRKGSSAQTISRDILELVSAVTRIFEIDRREWFRSVVSADPQALTRVRQSGRLTKAQTKAIDDGKGALEVLTDRYLDNLLSVRQQQNGGLADATGQPAKTGGPTETGGWFPAEVQAELDHIEAKTLAAYELLRSARNHHEHASEEAFGRLRAAWGDMASLDPSFKRADMTPRSFTDMLRVRNLTQLETLLGCIPDLWRAMVVAETTALTVKSGAGN